MSLIVRFAGIVLVYSLLSCARGQTDEATTSNPLESKTSSVIPARDSVFVLSVANSGLLNVSLAELVKLHAANEAVLEIGQKIIDEQGKANDDLKEMLQVKGMKFPVSLSIESTNIVDSLRNKEAKDFDKEYLALMSRYYIADIKVFREEFKNGMDPDIRRWASYQIPVIEDRLKSIEEAREKVK